MKKPTARMMLVGAVAGVVVAAASAMNLIGSGRRVDWIGVAAGLVAATVSLIVAARAGRTRA